MHSYTNPRTPSHTIPLAHSYTIPRTQLHAAPPPTRSGPLMPFAPVQGHSESSLMQVGSDTTCEWGTDVSRGTDVLLSPSDAKPVAG